MAEDNIGTLYDTELIGNVYDIQKFSVHDGPGIRTTVFLKGCPLSCLWCHSPESQRFESDVAFMEIKCIGLDECGICKHVCPCAAIRIGETKPTALGDKEITYPELNRSLCNECMKCTSICPSTALYDPRKPMTVEEVLKKAMQDRRFYLKSGGGVTISGGEPMSQFAFTLALCKRLKAEGIHVALDTTGYAPTERFLEILPYVDLFLYDLKHMDSHHHKMLTGVPNDLIHKNARELAKNGARFQIRYPMIPKLNAGAENVKATAEFCVEIQQGIDVVQLLPYHKLGKMKYDRLGRPYRLTNVEAPSDEFMQESLKLFQSYGLNAMIH